MADETPRIPANDNPWYVLATFHGEQKGENLRDIDRDLYERNRQFWNCWMAADLPDEEQQRLLDKGWVTQEGLEEVRKKGRDALWTGERCSGLPTPDPDDGINFKATVFPGLLSLKGMLFQGDADFQDAEFQGYAYFRDAEFQGDADFQDAEFQGDADFRDAEFQGDADFQDAEFQGYADFQDAEFQGDAYFRDAEFQGDADFQDAEFQGVADFQDAEFQGDADFQDAEFQGDAYFRDAEFQGNADFKDAEFQGNTYFLNVKCQGKNEGEILRFDFMNAAFHSELRASGIKLDLADFRSSVFKADVNFQGGVFRHRADFFKSIFLGPVNFSSDSERTTQFLGPAEFGKAEFVGKVDFTSVVFEGPVSFKGVANVDGRIRARQFGGEVKFDHASFGNEVSFVNREFLDETSFRSAKFLRKAPKFADSTLHEGTTWHGVQWPQAPSDPGKARDMADAYSHLRRRSNAIQDHESELDFFAREMQSKRVADGGLKGLLILAYGLSCDFGRSVGRPLAWLFSLWLLPLVAYVDFLRLAGIRTIEVASLYGFSATSIGGFFGVRKEFFSSTFMEKLPDAALVLSGFQSVLGAVFLFLLGLSLRNRFRIK
jgi:hypothetical protein